MNRKEKYDDFDEWETDVFRAGATQVLEVGENIFYAIRTPNNKPVQSDADGMFDLRSRRGREVMKTATTIGGWAGGSGEIYRHIVSRAGKARPYANPKGVYTTYSAWRAAAKKAGAVRFEGDKDIAQAFDATGFGVAEWDGAEGYIYRKSEMRNPMRREDPLYVKYLSLKSGEEPLMMQGTKYEYVWAEYPGGVKDIGVYSYANDLVYSYDSFRQMMNLPNPVTRRKGETARDFTARCMSEEKASFPKTKQRIAVCLSKSRKRNPVYDTGSDE
jgi:hypothetical protein